MKFYVDKIEQTHGEAEGTYNEYGSRTKKDTYEAALTEFYTTLTNVSNSQAHVWLDIKITNSEGGCLKKDSIGHYVESTPASK